MEVGLAALLVDVRVLTGHSFAAVELPGRLLLMVWSICARDFTITHV